jgi:hypothetical protein
MEKEMKKPYIRKLGKFLGFDVMIVDGKYIRDNMDEEFANFGQPLDFKFIPKNELWIDKEHSGNESRFFIANMLAQHRMMAKGKSFDNARIYANKIERKMRANSKICKSARKKIKHRQEILKRIHKKLLEKYSNDKIRTWVVNGELVRDLFFIEFTEGGNDEIYPFVPEGEIWLDDDLSMRERRFVLLHELHERNLMSRGWSYDEGKRAAHWSAAEIEHFCRRYPQFLDAKIKIELKKVK